jgi:hypothetical protein
MAKERKPIPYVVLDSSVLTNGMRVMVAGVDISQFEKNPVMLYDHNDYQLPIGRWENVRKENDMILADAILDYDDTDKEVQRIIGKVERGFLKACTAGLVDLEASDDPMLMLSGQRDYTIVGSRLREISLTPIGRNHNGLKLYDKEGNVLELNEKTDTKLLLSDFIVSPKINKKMSKKYLQFLNLSDTATDEMVEVAVEKLHNDKEAAVARAAKAENDLNALQLADKTAKRDAFANEVDAAIRAGQIDEKADGSVKASFLDLFDKSPEAARTTLGALPKPTALKNLELGDKDSKEFKELEAMDYGAMDKAGKVLLCKDKYPEMFHEKYKAKFGTEYKKD